jgi:hypothetical protein
MGGDGFWEGQASGQEEGGPVNTMEADDFFADEVEVGGPILLEVGFVVAAIAQGCDVVGEGVQPDVDDVFLRCG